MAGSATFAAPIPARVEPCRLTKAGRLRSRHPRATKVAADTAAQFLGANPSEGEEPPLDLGSDSRSCKELRDLAHRRRTRDRRARGHPRADASSLPPRSAPGRN